jgi:DNA repair protein RadA/Sms
MAGSAQKTLHVCQSCGFGSPKWLGRCPGCGEWNSLVEEAAGRPSAGLPGASAVLYPQIAHENFVRIRTGDKEFDRVLGGGVVPGSLVLIGGEPGVGKSTLLLQMAENLSRQGLSVLYAAGEESAQQIKMRGERLEIEGKNLLLCNETCLEKVLDEARRLKPGALVIDSIQTMQTERIESIAGSIGQIRECAGLLLSYAKTIHTPVFLIGHITKDGALAGPKTLEHVVDVVLYFEGEKHQNHRIVRAVKNRFGPANELGIFQMSGKGLVSVDSPSRLFLSERAESSPGSVVLCAVEGSRPVLVELQALVTPTNYGTGRRTANGVDANRVALLLAMLEKRMGLHLMTCDVYVNVAGGLELCEPAVDLAIVSAIVSSFRNRPVDSETVVFGEVGLAGEVRAVTQPLVRAREAATMGFKRVILPKSHLPVTDPPTGLTMLGVSSVQEHLAWLD